MEIATPLGEDVLLFHGMQRARGAEPAERVSSSTCSARRTTSTSTTSSARTSRSSWRCPTTARATSTATSRASRRAACYGRYHRYVADGAAVALVPDAHGRLPHLPGDDGPGHRQEGVRAIIRRADFKFELTGTYRKWTYCVQYRETDFNFVSRLMEHEGIYYYFRHTDGHNTLVLTDSTSKHTPVAGYETIPFIAPEQLVQAGARARQQLGLRARGPAGRLRARRLRLRAAERRAEDAARRCRASYAPSDYEVYDYPGRLRAEGRTASSTPRCASTSSAAQFETAQAATNARGLAVGSLFTLERPPARGSEPRAPDRGGELRPASSATTRRCRRAAAPSYQCTLRGDADASSSSGRARTTPKPFVQGPQTAVVVGPAGDEIYTDKYGRVKVQFHWDRRRQEGREQLVLDPRVAAVGRQGLGRGVASPRIGQEVIVDFLEGDPDQPIITGRVYNAEQMPPYDAAGEQDAERASRRAARKGGGAGQLQRDPLRGQEGRGAGLHPRREEPGHRGRERRDALGRARPEEDDRQRRDDARQARSDRDGRQQRDDHDARNRTETVDKNETITIGRTGRRPSARTRRSRSAATARITVSKSETATVALQRTHTVGVNETITRRRRRRRSRSAACRSITVGAAQTISVGANQTISVGIEPDDQRSAAIRRPNVGKNQTVDVGGDEKRRTIGGKRETTSVGKDDALKVGKNLAITRGDSVTIKTGDASITMKKDGTIVDQGQGHHDRRQRQDQRQGEQGHRDEGLEDPAELGARMKDSQTVTFVADAVDETDCDELQKLLMDPVATGPGAGSAIAEGRDRQARRIYGRRRDAARHLSRAADARRTAGARDARPARRTHRQKHHPDVREWDPRQPIVVGCLHEPTSALGPATEHVAVDADGERLVVSAKDQIVLRCGKASITLTKEGRVIIQGALRDQSLLRRAAPQGRLRSDQLSAVRAELM